MCTCLSVNAAETQSKDDVELLPDFLLNDSEHMIDAEEQKADSRETARFGGKSNIQFWMDQTVTYTDWRESSDLILGLDEDESPNWWGLTRLNSRGSYSIFPTFEVKYDSSLNITLDGDGFQSSDDLRLDLEELYFSWKSDPSMFIDMGRINVRNGIATGFNPTDYFRVNSVVTRTTEDVRRLRDNRLGTLAARMQKIWDGGSLALVIAPDVGNKEDRWYTDKSKYGLHLNSTNNRSSYMLSWTDEIVSGFSPEVLILSESGRKNIGLNLSYALNQKTLAIMELNRGERLSIINEALYSPEDIVSLHPLLESAFPNRGESYFTLSAIGISYTSDQRITTNIEYYYNEAGLDRNDWDVYFDVAETSIGNPAIIGPLLSVKGVARSRLEPISKHTAMIRSTWTDFKPDLSANILIYYDLVDNSSLTQMEMLWNYNSQLTFTARLSAYDGDSRSNFGSLEQKLSAGIQLDYYF